MWSHSQTWGGCPPGPRSSPRESVIKRSIRTLQTSHGSRALALANLPGDTLTTGLSPLDSLESHTQSCTDTWRHSCQAAAGRIPHLPAADRSSLGAPLMPSRLSNWPSRPCGGILVIATIWSSEKHCVAFSLSVGPSRPSASGAAPEPVFLDTSQGMHFQVVQQVHLRGIDG